MDQQKDMAILGVRSDLCIELNLLGFQVKLTLEDMSSVEDYDRMKAMFYRRTDVILLCFSIDSPGTTQTSHDQP